MESKDIKTEIVIKGLHENVVKRIDKLKELLDKRKPYYERADYHVNTSSVSIDDAVESILKFVKEK